MNVIYRLKKNSKQLVKHFTEKNFISYDTSKVVVLPIYLSIYIYLFIAKIKIL